VSKVSKKKFAQHARYDDDRFHALASPLSTIAQALLVLYHRSRSVVVIALLLQGANQSCLEQQVSH
jgi:hypothetical protein